MTAPATLSIGLHDVRRVSMETACDDHDVVLDPGTYPVRFTTVNFHDCEPDKAYWVLASIPCTRVRNGVRFGKAGERGTYHYQTWLWSFAEEVRS